MKNCVYNIFDEVSNSKFPGFSKVNFYILSSILLFSIRLSASAFSGSALYVCRLSGWNAHKMLVKLYLYPADGIIKFIIWYILAHYLYCCFVIFLNDFERQSCSPFKDETCVLNGTSG